MSEMIIGLTGGIGSGKTTVANLFAAHGIEIIDTDQIAHQLTAPSGAAMPAILETFGPALILETGAMNRAAMRELVFKTPHAKAQLESILHPRIHQTALAACQAARSPYALLAVPLLVESGRYHTVCERILVVDCHRETQIARVMQRNQFPREQVESILAHQATREARLAAADDVINNDNAPEGLTTQVNLLHAKYLRLLAEKPQAKC